LNQADAGREKFLKGEGYFVAHIPNGIALKDPEGFIAKVRRLCEELELRRTEEG
jgi:hypothetical protein